MLRCISELYNNSIIITHGMATTVLGGDGLPPEGVGLVLSMELLRSTQ